MNESHEFRADAGVSDSGDTTTPPTSEREASLQRQVDALVVLTRELGFARDSAEASNRAKGEFLATVSQEIRTPMQGLVGLLDLLSDTPLSADQMDLVDTARASADSLVAIVNDVVDFASSESIRPASEPLPFDLRRSIEDVAARFASRANNKGVEIMVQYGSDTPQHVIGDAEQVHQILLQVVDNAVRFTDQGHVLVAVDSPIMTDGDMLVRIVVQDTGIGITPDRLPLIFSRADSSAGSRSRSGGQGGGLAAARQLAERMGGTIIASSEPGEGSVFTITARLARDLAGAEEAPSSPLAGVHALVVDDVALHRMVMQRQMSGFGMRVEMAPDGDTALQMTRDAVAAGDPFRILLVDQVMPGMSGEEFGIAYRQEPGAQNASMMLFTATVQREEMRKYARAGFDGYFIKPIRPSELQEALAAALRARRKGAATAEARPREIAPAIVAASPSTGAHAGRHVLLVEDNAINQKVGRRMLEKLGCAVDVAANGREAVDAWRRGTYDAIFMDCQMPVMDGYEATLEIRRNESDNRRRTPIIALTANALPSDRERCFASGMDDFMAKPVRENALRTVLDGVLGVAAA